MVIMRQVVVFDAADLAAESAFWAGMLGGRVLPDDRWHSVFDGEGRWVTLRGTRSASGGDSRTRKPSGRS